MLFVILFIWGCLCEESHPNIISLNKLKHRESFYEKKLETLKPPYTFYIDVTIGEYFPRNFQVIPDTGSSITWVKSSSLNFFIWYKYRNNDGLNLTMEFEPNHFDRGYFCVDCIKCQRKNRIKTEFFIDECDIGIFLQCCTEDDLSSVCDDLDKLCPRNTQNINYNKCNDIDIGSCDCELFNFNYLRGGILGYLVKDNIDIFNGKSSKIIKRRHNAVIMKFGSIYNDNNTKVSLFADGVLGLTPTNNSIISLLQEKGEIDRRVFAFYLGNMKGTGGPKLLIGDWNYYNPHTGKPYYIPNEPIYFFRTMHDQSFSIQFKSIAYGSGSDSTTLFQNNITEIDSGTSFIVAPISVNKTLYKIFKKYNFMEYNNTFRVWEIIDPKKNCKKLESLYIQMNSTVTLELEPEYYIIEYPCGYYGPNPRYFVGILTVDGINGWLLGNNFMKKFYTIFDIDRQQVGIGYNAVPEPYAPACPHKN